MKAIKYSVFLMLLVCVGYFYGMKRRAPDSSSGGGAAGAAALPFNQVYFSSAEREEDNIRNRLLNFLDKGDKQILIAAYRLTDPDIIAKLIDKKKKGVDVQVIIDESALDNNPVIHHILKNWIHLLIYPSGMLGSGLMHNKFIVIDGSSVFTGSANFTKAGLGVVKNKMQSNYENAVIINEPTIAQQFKDTFIEISQDIFNLYIRLIANRAQDYFPNWFKNLLSKLPNNKLQEAKQGLLKSLSVNERQRLRDYFSFGPRIGLSQKQIDYLIEDGYSIDDIDMMTRDEARINVGKAMKKKRSQSK